MFFQKSIVKLNLVQRNQSFTVFHLLGLPVGEPMPDDDADLFDQYETFGFGSAVAVV